MPKPTATEGAFFGNVWQSGCKYNSLENQGAGRQPCHVTNGNLWISASHFTYCKQWDLGKLKSKYWL